MIVAMIIFFILAILLGFILLSYIFQNKNTPKALAFIHGPFAALGLVLLIIYTFANSSTILIISIILFILAALGGSVLIYLDLTNKHIPKIFALFHGLIALSAFVLAMVGIFNN